MHIRIPRYLPSFAMSNTRLQKALSIYLYIKAIDDSGFITWDQDKNKAAAKIFGCSERTVKNWINLAFQFEIIKRSGKHGLAPLAWNALLEKCEIRSSGYYLIAVNSEPISLPLILKHKAMLEAYKRCQAAMLRKAKNPIVKDELERVLLDLSYKLPIGINPTQLSALSQCQRFDFLTANKVLTPNQRFLIFIANPDLSIGVTRFSQLFGYKGASGFCYLKKKMANNQMITVEKREPLEVPHHYFKQMTTTESRETVLGKSEFFKPAGTVVLTLCDKINLTPQKHWKPFKTLQMEKI